MWTDLVGFVSVAVKKYRFQMFGTFVLRTPDLYDEAINLLNQSELLPVDGVKRECPLNILTGFHACQG